MKKQNTIRAGIIMLLFFAFAYAKAGLIPNVSTTPACHSNDGTVTITGTGVTGPFYIYIWAGGISQSDSNVVSSATFTGLLPGTYQFYIYAANADAQGTFTIASTVTLSITTTQPVCPVSTTGSAVANAAGGAPPYTYAWSNGATTQTATNLVSGLNWVTVTDQNGCYNIYDDTVQVISPVQCTINHTGSVCSGTLTAAITGGATPYSYHWSTGATTSSITGFSSNNYYNVSVTDANGCQGLAQTYVGNSSLVFDSVLTQAIRPTCGSNGSISVQMASGSAPYTYLWSNGATSAHITGLASNYYYVTVTDANGCTGQNQYYLYGSSLTEYFYSSNPDCGSSNGAIYVYGYGGATPYTYTWTGNSTNHASVDSALSPGTYNFSVTDANGCTIADSAYLFPQGNFTAQATVQPIICPATTGGSITVSVTGAGPYTYLWSNGATTQTLSGLSEGLGFSVTATDGSGCQAVASSDTVGIAAPFSLSLTAPACGNTTTVNVINGSTGPYTYRWSNGATSASINYSLYNYYVATVTDANGCSASKDFYPYTTGIQLDSFNSVTNPTCLLGGSIVATPLNGTAPYTYTWSNGASSASITGLAAGYYQVTVADANGCTGIGYYYLGENTITVYPNNSSLNCGASDGSITLTAYGGTPPYNYTWSNTSTNHTNRDTLLTAGSYDFTVTDAGGCSVTSTDILNAQGTYSATVSATPTSCNQNTPTGAVNVTITNGGTAPFTFSWELWDGHSYTYPVTTSGLTGLSFGSIAWLTQVTDANGCTDSSIHYANTDTAGAFINYAPSCYNDITGYAYTDLNGNCTKDAGEAGFAGVNIEAAGTNGQYFYASTDSTGFYDVSVLPGTYTVSAFTYTHCNGTACNNTYTHTFSGTGGVATGNNFGYNGGPAYDLIVHTGYLPSVPGSSKEYWVYYYNEGAVSASNAVLTFVHDPNLTLTSTNPPYSSYNATNQTITWNIGTVPVSYLGANQQVTMQFDVPSSLSLGTLLSATALITPVSDDCQPSNNSQTLTDPVTGSHDPNVKEVSPSGNITASDSVLTYTIRFQNTGNAPATRVIIVDTLSPLVNPATLVVGASSSHYTYTLSGNGIITFTFDPIYLPDSSQGQDSSSGFVMYSVNIRNNDVVGQQIKNTAYIYFDFNPAVVTNTTVSTLSFPSGIKNLNTGSMNVSVSPNPVHDKSVFSIEGATGEVLFNVDDVTGQRIFEKNTSDNNITFNSGSFAAGIYIYTARDAKGNICTGKIVIAH